MTKKSRFIKKQLKLAHAGGKISDREKRMLKALRKDLKISDSVHRNIENENVVKSRK